MVSIAVVGFWLWQKSTIHKAVVKFSDSWLKLIVFRAEFSWGLWIQHMSLAYYSLGQRALLAQERFESQFRPYIGIEEGCTRIILLTATHHQLLSLILSYPNIAHYNNSIKEPQLASRAHSLAKKVAAHLHSELFQYDWFFDLLLILYPRWC